MKKVLCFSLLTLLLFVFTSGGVANVYICKGKYSKKYHYNKNCRGLSNCSTDIYKISLEKAKDIGRTLCGVGGLMFVDTKINKGCRKYKG